jgi:hypothetical protein
MSLPETNCEQSRLFSMALSVVTSNWQGFIVYFESCFMGALSGKNVCTPNARS